MRSYFEEWMGKVQVNPRSKEVAFYEDMVGEIDVHTLDRQDNRTARWVTMMRFPDS